MALTQKNRQVSINTPLGEDVVVVRKGTLTEEISRPFLLTLDLLSEDYQIAFEDILGQNITVRVALPQQEDQQRYINGFVSRFTRTGPVEGGMRYLAEVVPSLWFLTRASDCRIFQNLSAPDVIKQVLRDKAISDFEETLSGTHPVREYCVQYRETDFEFVSRLMEEEGIYYYFRHENGRHFLVMIDSNSSHKTMAGYEKIPVIPEDQPRGMRHVEHITEWTATAEIQTGVYTHSSFDFTNIRKDLTVNSSVARSHAASSFEVYDYTGRYVDRGAGEYQAKCRIQELACRHETHHGRGDARGLSAGFVFEPEERGSVAPSGKFLTLSSKLEFSASDYHSSSTGPSASGEGIACEFTAIPDREQYRPPRDTPRPRMAGPQTAIVAGPAGDEILTDSYGRVKVQFPWDRSGKGDENSSCWVRVGQAWAGKNWGSVFNPRIGQEVIVDFLEGDPDRPIIIGRVYNAQAMPPYELPANKTMSTIKSSSSTGGVGFNEIRFEDKAGQENVFIHAERDQDDRVKNDCREWVGNNRHLIVTTDQREKVGNNLHVTVGTNHEEKAGSKYAVDAGQEIHLKSGMKVVIEAGVQLSLKGPGGFVDIGPAGVTIQGTLVNINSGGAAGSGSGASPQDPDVAIDSDPTQLTDVAARQFQATPPSYGSSVVNAQGQGGAGGADQEKSTTWISIVLKDDKGKPIAGEPYRLKLPDGTVLEGALDANGKDQVAGLDPGTCQISFPRIDKGEWRPA